MPDSTTTHYGLTKPAVNDATGASAWGGKLNADMDLIDAQMYTNAQGLAAVTGTWTGTQLSLNKATVAAGNPLRGLLSNVLRWIVNLGDSASEPGSGNAGSNFTIQRCSDAGSLIDTPLTILRATGQTQIRSLALSGGASVANAPVNPTDVVNKTYVDTNAAAVAFVGEIRMWGGAAAPNANWMLCRDSP
jgi:hypothetical protein